MAKPWGGMKSWAADAEAEEEQRKAAEASGASANTMDFPSLSEAASNKPKKKKGQTLTLQQLQQGVYVGPRGSKPGSDVKGLTTQEMMALPTGPRERTGEEDRFGSLGGGFRDYGRGSSGSSRFENRDRKSFGGFDDERRQRGSDRDMISSRADEADNWGASKKAIPPPDQYEKRRYSEDRFEGAAGGSRADEVDNWGAAKKFQPSAAAPPPSDRRGMGFGSSYRDSADSDRWGRRESVGDRPRVIVDPPRSGTSLALSSETNDEVPRASRPNPFGNARPREEVLAEKRKDEVEVEVEVDSGVENKDQLSRPGSSHSSHPGSPRNRLEVVTTKPKPKINPFGQARPREEVLKEQGKDYKKIDFELEHRGIERSETEEEIKLKQEISALKEDLAKQEGRENTDVNGEGPIGDEPSLSEMIIRKEKELEQLTRDLDDKVRFVKRSGDRPGSATGRAFESLDRPMSQSGRSDSGRSFESFDSRPRSRGGEAAVPDIWRSGDDRRAGYGYRDRSFSYRDRAPDSKRW